MHLAMWLNHQRWRINTGEVSPEQRQALERLGLCRSARQDAWDRKCAAAVAYLAREGHLSPPKHHREDGILLARWFETQRALHRQGRIPADRLPTLVRLGVLDATQPPEPDPANHSREGTPR